MESNIEVPKWFKKTGKSVIKYERQKRIFDIILLIILLPFVIPLVIVITGWIIIVVGNPIIFTQSRFGKNGQVFKLYKFRTMKSGAEKEGLWTVNNDQRVISGCHWLRKTRLDEILQLWNIARGDLSFIGPRPQPYYVVIKKDQPYDIKPGVTGLFQICDYPELTEDEAKFNELIICKVYFNNFSWCNELLIICQTIQVMLLFKGN